MIQRSNDLQNDELGMEVIVLSDRMVNWDEVETSNNSFDLFPKPVSD
jgi:hypothetical protein